MTYTGWLRPSGELTIDKVSGLGDDHGCGDKRTFIILEQLPAGHVVPVGAIGCCEERARIDDEHLVAPEPFGQHLIGLGRAVSGGGLTYGGEV